MAGYRGLIFDMDGTLLDSLADLGESMNRVLRREGLPTHPIDAYRLYIGDGATNLALRVLPEERRHPELIARVRDAWSAEYDGHWAEQTRLYPGVPELLDALTRRGLPMAVFSNKPHEFTARMAEHFLGRWRLAPVLGARDGVPRKPDPTVPLQIAGGWGLPAPAILYLGDTNTDMKTARAAGMFAVGALWGFREREELQSSGAQALVAHPLDVLPLLGPAGL